MESEQICEQEIRIMEEFKSKPGSFQGFRVKDPHGYDDSREGN